MSERIIIVDWGTSAFRAWLVDRADGNVHAEIPEGKGLLDLKRDDFPDYCRRRLAPWRGGEDDPLPVYMAGMVGSAQGWATAPQPPLPATADSIAAGIVPAPGLKNAWILPGCRRVDADGVPDVMRGEEVQVLGALELAGRRSATLCLPGSHSKWAWAADAALVDFTTSMTGEAYKALLEHTLLARTAQRDAPWSEPGFRLGLAQSERPGGLLHHLFTARSRNLMGELSPDLLPSYLSGLLVGHELAAMAPRVGVPSDAVLLVCASALRLPYEVAMSERGWPCHWDSSSCATRVGVILASKSHAELA